MKAIVGEVLGIDEGITGSKKLIDDLGCDSLDLVELMIEAEEVFGVLIYDEDAEQVVTVDDAVRLITEQRKKEGLPC